MAEIRLDTDAQGIITSEGKWKGYKLSDVMDYLEKLEAIADGEAPPVAPTKAAAPASPLASHAEARTEQLTNTLASRLEQDDEATFAASQPLYDTEIPGRKETFRTAVATLKQKLTQDVRAQKGIHGHLFNMIVQQVPELQEKIRRALAGEPQEELAAPPAEEVPDEEVENPPATPPPATTPSARTPKAAPPATPPTPASRAAAPPAGGARKPKLKGNERTEKFCKQFGLDQAKYLIELEDKGWTQERLDQFQIPGNRSLAATRGGGKKSAFDYVDE